MALKKTECTCATCQQGCTNTPGWFRPGEAEKAAKLMGLSMQKFFDTHLGVNWWVGDGRNTYVLAPALVDHPAGEEYPGNPKGTCVFFKDGRCAIHAAKPFDCSHGNLCDKTDAAKAEDVKARAKTVRLWKRQQAQIRRLLGRKPESAPFPFFDALYWR